MRTVDRNLLQAVTIVYIPLAGDFERGLAAVASEPQSEANPSSYPEGGTYAELLRWHMDIWGTRADGSTSEPGDPWLLKIFASLVHEEGFDPENARKNVANWKDGPGPPNDPFRVKRIEAVLFGKNPEFRRWKEDMRVALAVARGARPPPDKQPIPIPSPLKANPPSVPQPTGHFTGRDDERDALAAALTSGEALAVLVQGGPGIGKTEFTKAVGHHAAVIDHFGERRWFISLEAATTAEAMKDTVVRALGCDPTLGFQAALISLKDRRSLLILDNLDTSWEPRHERSATEGALADLAAVAGVTLLASIRGLEWVAQPRWKSWPLKPLSIRDSIDLFLSISGYFDNRDPILRKFIDVLGGIPLAIELVARRARGRKSLVPLWQEWLRIGVEFARGPDVGRLTSLTHSIELSLKSSGIYKSSTAKRLFSILGRSPYGILRDQINYIFKDGAFDAEEILVRSGLATSDIQFLSLLPHFREYASIYNLPDTSDAVALIVHYIENIKNPPMSHHINRLNISAINCVKVIVDAELLEDSLTYIKKVGLNHGSWYDLYIGILEELLKKIEKTGNKLMEAKCNSLIGEILYVYAEFHSSISRYEVAAKLYNNLGMRIAENICLGEIEACRRYIARYNN